MKEHLKGRQNGVRSYANTYKQVLPSIYEGMNRKCDKCIYVTISECQ